MRAVHLSRLTIRSLSLDDLGLLHAEWTLGLGRFSHLRERRLAMGIPANAVPRDIAGDRLRIGFPEPGGTKRTSIIKLTTGREGTLVDHFCWRDGPEHRLRHATAETPGVVEYLVRSGQANLGPDPADGTAHPVSEDDIHSLVDRMLARHRGVPLVLVSIVNATHEALLDPLSLARRLTGMAHVCFLNTVRSSRLLKDELLARGFSDKYGCYNGGVRIVWPGVAPQDDPYDHLLLLPTRLLGVPEHAREEHVAGVFCEMIAEHEDPRAWIRELDGPRTPPPPPEPDPEPPQASRSSSLWRFGSGTRSDRAKPDTNPTTPQPLHPTASASPTAPSHCSTPTAQAETPTTLAERPNPTPPTSPPRMDAATDHAPVDSPQVETPPPSSIPAPAPPAPAPKLTLVTATAQPAPEDELINEPPSPAPPRAKSHWGTLADDVLAAFDLAAELERDLEAKQRELLSTRKALRRAEQKRDEATGGQGKPQTVAAALTRAEGLFADRLVVLPSARSSAEDSPYKHPARVFEVLAILALFGRHDRDLSEALAKSLGNVAEWKPKDSPQTRAKFGDARTWSCCSGTPKLFDRHVTIGGSLSATRCLQLYYDVLPDGRIELAWCGEHRPTVGKDT